MQNNTPTPPEQANNPTSPQPVPPTTPLDQTNQSGMSTVMTPTVKFMAIGLVVIAAIVGAVFGTEAISIVAVVGSIVIGTYLVLSARKHK